MDFGNQASASQEPTSSRYATKGLAAGRSRRRRHTDSHTQVRGGGLGPTRRSRGQDSRLQVDNIARATGAAGGGGGRVRLSPSSSSSSSSSSSCALARNYSAREDWRVTSGYLGTRMRRRRRGYLLLPTPRRSYRYNYWIGSLPTCSRSLVAFIYIGI